MKITVVNGTEKQGVTYRLKEIFLSYFRDKADITEFYMPGDCPGFCSGCTTCFRTDDHNCKDSPYVQKIEKSLIEADLLVFTSPTYVFHSTGAMKNLLDHFGHRWMVHRPLKEMFVKRAVIITQSLGAGERSAAKDIRDSLSWWGISSITECTFKLMGDILWEKLPEKKRLNITEKLKRTANTMLHIDYSRPAASSLVTKAKFYAVRMMQKRIGKTNPESTDYKYWKINGWLDNKRPWR